MPLSEVQRFHEQLKRDSNLFYSCNETLKGLSGEERTHKIVEFAKAHGFNFSAKELQKYEMLLKKFGEQNNTEPPENLIYKLYDHWLHFWQNLFFYFNFFGYRKSSVSMPDKKPESPPQPSQNKPKLSVNALERFFIWLSGSSPKILATCPDSEQRKHAALGGTVLIPVLFSVITSSFLLYTLNFEIQTILIASTIWSIIILMMDRALLATYRDEHSILAKFWRFLLRFFIALIIAMTIAHPMVLLLFSESINSVYDEERKPKLEYVTNSCSQAIKKISDEYNIQENDLKKLHGQQSPNYCAKQNSTSFYETEDGKAIQKEIFRLKDQKNKLEKEKEKFQLRADAAENGQCEYVIGKPLEKCKPGCGPLCKTAKLEAVNKGLEINEVNSKISNKENGFQKAKETFEQNNVAKQLTEEECNELKKVWDQRHAQEENIKDINVKTLSKKRTELEEICKSDEKKIRELQPDILTQTLILHKIILGKDGKAINYGAMSIFLAFMLLFLMIDMLAVVLKFTSIGVYDLKVNMDESNSALSSFIEAHINRVAYFIQAELGEREKLNTCKYGTLKQKLENGLDLLEDSFCDDDHAQSNAFFKTRSNGKK